MFVIRTVVMLGLVLGLGACVSGGPGTEPGAAGRQVAMYAMQYDVAEVKIIVPPTLKVSEANSYRPTADIVWRGEAPGDRYAQVKAIMADGFATGTAGMVAGRKVIVEAEVVRFHCLTEKARYVIGGVHSLRFNLTVRDAATGQIVDGPRLVIADIKAAGGEKALAEDRAGRSQRVVIVEQLAKISKRELSARVAPAVSQ